MPRQGRAGFTLVELLLVVAIIAVLIGLLLPAVQKVRESASRTKCQCNMGQLALATIQHEQIFGRFPAGYQSKSPEGNPTGWGWAIPVLPFLEQEALVRNMILDKSILDEANAPFREIRLPLLMCPSDWMSEAHEIELPPLPTRPHEPPPITQSIKFSPSQYTAMAGTMGTDSPQNTGIVFRDSRVRAEDITDGLAHTLLHTEKASRVGQSIWHGALPGVMVRPPRMRGQGSPPEEPDPVFPSSSLVLSTTRGIDRLESIKKPADTFGSFHLTGANVSFADGHVEYLSGAQPEDLLAAWATRSSGEVSPAP